MKEYYEEEGAVSLEQELKEMVLKDLGVKDVKLEDFADDTPLFGEGIGLDSLDAVELVIQIRKKYGVRIEYVDNQRKALATIGSLANFIRAQQGGA